MKKGISTIALVSALFLGNTVAQAQAGLKKADKQYDQWAYVDALDIYEKVENRGYSSQSLHENLGNANYFNARYTAAEKQYERLFAEYSNEDIAPEYYYRYAQTLQHVGKETEAKQYYNTFVSKVGKSQIGEIRKNEAELKAQIQANSGRYSQITNLSINTPFADYGSYVHNNNLYFTSARDTGSLSKKVHTWTGAAFTSLYQYSLQNETDNGKNQKVQRIKGDVKSKLNESTAVITKDGQTMYFTRNNIVKGTRKYDADKNTRLKIYRAELQNGKWVKVTELPFNSDDYSTAHPTLSADERTMYFASDRPGGFGESDLWQVSINNGSFGTPQNLGPQINTEARESFPYMNDANELYFSSDGRVGLGGLDVYATKLDKNNQFEAVQNLGAPVNSNADDFAYYINHSTKEGFFSSNREGGMGNDDIYSFVEDKEINRCQQDLVVTVVDAKTRNILTDVEITLYDRLYNSLGTSHPTSKGNQFTADYVCGEMYRLKVAKADYIIKEETVTLDTTTGITEKTVVLERKKVEVKKNDDLFKVLQLNPIYFDLDKDNIRPDAAVELAKVVEVLKEYPRMKIDVRSHTDSRASDAYNLKLSQRRAKSTANWMIAQGIDAARITYKGYGETQLENRCSNGVKCSEEEHQQNRRSEFIVLDM
ncbi:OmpA family protein [Flavobacterium sp. xlx-214]|nr:OmpA family protein [Flavobacterium sp. xlx-214]QMI83302.1 OmpA family protein [Flavobacterium sp. xlx-214]